MKGINRRHFLKTSATLAVGSAAMTYAAVPNGPNARIRVAVVGLNGRGQEHIQGFSKLSPMNVELAALCDVDENVLNKRLDQCEKANAKRPVGFTDVRKLLEDKSIDVVSFATPNHWHALGAIWACQAGKDVYVEKPCSHNIWEGRKIVEAARKYNRIVQHGTQIRSYKGFQEAVKFLQEGKLGKIKVARGLCYNPRPSIGHQEDEAVPAGVNYDL